MSIQAFKIPVPVHVQYDAIPRVLGARRASASLRLGSYEQSPQQAVASATRMLKEGGMDAVKLEARCTGRRG
jgi:ketopantoate hydroxymethyltransferase